MEPTTVEMQTPAVAPGFWLRAGAYMIDGFLVTLISIPFFLVFQKASGLLQILIQWGYSTVLVAGYGGQTWGKRLAGIAVIRMDGSPVGYGRAFARAVAYLLSYVILGIGFLMAIFTENRRTLHDFITDTRVVKVQEVSGGRKFFVILAGFFFPLVAIVGILAAIAIPQFAQTISKSQEGAAKANLGVIRSALSIHYGDTTGRYPKSLDELTVGGKYLPQIPALVLPKTKNNIGHASSTKVTYGKLSDGVTDEGGWFYDPSEGMGNILINCSHQDLRGKRWDQF